MSYFNLSDKNIAHVFGYEAEWIQDVQSQIDRLNEAKKMFLFWDGIHLLAYVNKTEQVTSLSKVINIDNEVPATVKLIDTTDIESIFEYFNEGIFDALLTNHWMIEHNHETHETFHQLIILASAIQQDNNKYSIADHDALFAEVHKSMETCEVPAVINHFSKMCFLLENWDIMVPLLSKAVQMMPEFADPYNSLGIISWKLDKKKEAMGFFAEALIKNPYPHNTILNIIDVVKDLGEYSGLARVLQHVLDKDPALDDCSLALAMVLMKLNKSDEAKLLLENLLKSNPNDKDIHGMLSSIQP